MRSWRRYLGAACAWLLLSPWLAAPSAQTLHVLELHLVLAFDVSASVNDVEFDLQRHGTAAAQRDPAVARAIRTADGGIAISIVQWSSIKSQALGLDWHWLQDADDLRVFADTVAAMPRRLPGGGTMIHAGLAFAEDQFGTAPHVARRQVIDLSGNGQTDNPEELRAIRDRLLKKGITINALAIQEDLDDLSDYFYTELIGGTHSFVITANDWEDFGRAMQIKLLREISGAVFSEATLRSRVH